MLHGVSEHAHPIGNGRFIEIRNDGRLLQIVETNALFIQPLPIGIAPGDLVLELDVVDNPAFLEVNEEHAPRLEPAFETYPFRGYIQDSNLTGHNDHVVVSDVVAART